MLVGSYTFVDGTDFFVEKGPRIYRGVILLAGGGRDWRKELHDRDLERLFLRGLSIIKKNTEGELLLAEQEGIPLPFDVRTEEDMVKEFARGFWKEHPQLLKDMRLGIWKSREGNQ